MLPHHIESKKDMETRQSRMYEYMTRRECCRRMKSISEIKVDLITLQQKEEEEYQGLLKWMIIVLNPILVSVSLWGRRNYLRTQLEFLNDYKLTVSRLS